MLVKPVQSELARCTEDQILHLLILFNQDGARRVQLTVKLGYHSHNQRLRRLIFAPKILKKVLQCLPVLPQHIQCQSVLQFRGQLAIKMIFGEVVSRRIFDIFFHHGETLVEKTMVQCFALSSHTYTEKVKFHLRLLFGHNFIEGLDTLILKNKVGHG